MAKVLLPPACDASLLSAYRDDVLNADQRQMVALHLTACPACRQEVQYFEHLAVGLRHLAGEAHPRPLPSTFRPSPALLAPARQPRRASSLLLRTSLAAAALVLVVLVQRAPQSSASLIEAYPAAGASDVSTDTSILITFQEPVDQAQVQRTLQFQPSVLFDITWQSAQRAELVPLLPLVPATTYTLSAAVPPGQVATSAAPRPTSSSGPTVVLLPRTLTVFQTAARSVADGGPLALIPRLDVATHVRRASISQPVLAVPATPSPVGLPNTKMAAEGAATLLQRSTSGAPILGLAPQSGRDTAAPGTSTSGAAVDPTTPAAALAASLEQPALLPPCAPANVFTPIYTSRGDVRTALGCVQGTTRTTDLVTQDFQYGELLATLPDGLVYELTGDGLWRASPRSEVGGRRSDANVPRSIGAAFQWYWQEHPVLMNSLGLSLSPELHAMGIMQPFAHGFMLATTSWTYIADDAGQWQRLVSLLPAPDGGSPDGGAVTGGVASFPPLRQPPSPGSAPAMAGGER